MGLTKKNTGGVPVSLSQCNGLPGAITIDDVQDLTDYSLTFENSRMKADAHRRLNTGDATDLELSADKTYYVLISVGTAAGSRTALQVGYHGASATQTLVCVATLTEKGECKPPSEWEPDVKPVLGSTSSTPLTAAGLLSLGVWAMATF